MNKILVKTSLVRFCIQFVLIVGTLLPDIMTVEAAGIPSAADPAHTRPSVRERERTIKERSRAPSVRHSGVGNERLHIPEQLAAQSIEVRGATVFNEETLRELWSPFLNRILSRDEVQNIADEITALYQRNGYILSRARFAGYDDASGTASFQVIEGYVSEVRFSSADDLVPTGHLHAYADKIRAARPLTTAALERYLYLMDDIPGITTSADLQVTFDQPGAVLQVAVAYIPVEGSIDINNRGTEYVGPLRASVSGRLNNIAGGGERIDFNVETTPVRPQELLYGQARWQQMINAEGTNLAVSGASYRVEPDLHVLAPGDALEGRGNAVSAELSHPLIRSRARNLWLVAGYNHEDTTAKLEGPGPDIRLYKDRLRTIVVGLAALFLNGENEGAASISVTRGLNVFGVDDHPSTNHSRADGHAEFTSLNATSSYRMRLDEASRWSVYSAVAAQFSFDPLLASAEFGLGGLDSVRAFDSFTFSGDSGAGGTLELRYEPSLFEGIGTQFYAFYDAGVIWNRGDHFAQPGSATAMAVGLGSRWLLGAGIFGYLELAAPINHTDAARADAALLFGLSARF